MPFLKFDALVNIAICMTFQDLTLCCHSDVKHTTYGSEIYKYCFVFRARQWKLNLMLFAWWTL